MLSSLYIHIPFCISKCAYCDFFSVTTENPFFTERFIKALINEIRAKMFLYAASGFSTVYIGGGTPSLIPVEQVSLLCDFIKRVSSTKKPSAFEWTVEMNPSDVTEQLLSAWARGGANRLSLGIQCLSDKALSALGRRGTAAQSIEALALASALWKGDISLDLIAGLPFQSASSITQDISELLEFKPAHVSLYQLTVESETSLFKLIEEGSIILPDEDESAEIWNAGKDVLCRAGFSRYEVSNFAIGGHESLHNMTYWRVNSFIGAGPGASGTLVEGNSCLRLENTKDIESWLLFWENKEEAGDLEWTKGALDEAPIRFERIEPRDFALETLMMGMRLSKGIRDEDFLARFSLSLDECFGGTIKKWERDGKLKREGGRTALTEEGLLFLNTFLVECFEEFSELTVLSS